MVKVTYRRKVRILGPKNDSMVLAVPKEHREHLELNDGDLVEVNLEKVLPK